MQPGNLQSFLSQNNAAAPQAPAAPRDNGNFLTHLLPTAGSILGGIGGALIPGLGETGIGEVGGASVGSAAGKAIEDLITGKQTSAGDLGGAALEGGVGQLTGMGIGKVAGGVLGKLGVAGEDMAKAQAAAQSMNDEFGGVSKAVRDKLNMNSNAAKFSEYGLPYTNDVINKVAPVITGGVDSEPGMAILHKGTVKAMQGANPVDVTDVQTLAQRIAKSPDLAAAGPTVGKTFMNDVSERLGNAQNPVDPHTGEVQSLLNTHAPSVFEVQQALEKAAYSTKNPAISDAYKQVANALDESLQKAGANDVAAQGLYSPEDLQKLAAISPKLAQEASSVTTVGGNRSLQAPFVQSANLASAAGKAAEGALPGVEQGPDILSQIAQGATHLATGGPAAKVGVLASLGKVGAPVLKSLASTGASIAKAGGAGSLPKVASQVVAHGGEYVNSPTGEPSMDQSQQPQQAGGAMGSGGDMNAVNLAKHLLDIMSVNPNQTATIAPILAQLIPQVQKTNVANEALQGYQGTLGAAGGPQGPIGGAFSQLGGLLTGGPAAQVGPEQRAAAAALANATGMTMEQALAALPGLQANQAGAQQGFGQAGSVLGALQ